MDLINRVNSFLELGNRIENLDHQSLHQLIEKANIQNPWFTEPFVRHAITGILNLLNKEKLENFQQEKYALLTKREKEILALLIDGKKLQEIAKHLFLSVHTVRTHWKNIKLKLNTNNNNVILSFFKQQKV